MGKTNRNKRERKERGIARKTGLLMVALLLAAFCAQAQDTEENLPEAGQQAAPAASFAYSVKGIVTDASTQAVFAGARISVVDEKSSAMTNEDGTFELRVPRPDVTLEVEAPGFLKQLVSLRGRAELRIELIRPVKGLYFYDQVGLQAGRSHTIAEPSPEKITVNEDITDRLTGSLRSITHSGTPGGGAAVFVNGLNSLNATAQPLYVVDGVVWQIQDSYASIHSGFNNNPLAVINPADVDKITVVRNGASVYGAKGANGVVLIDTKRGRSPSTEISVDLSTGYRAPFQSTPLMGAGEYRLYVSDVLSGLPKHLQSNLEQRYKFLDDDPSKSYYKATHNNTNWLDQINRGGLNQNYGISINGGDDIALYALSLGYTQSEGNIEGTGFDRINIRVNSDINLSKEFKLKFDIAFSQATNEVWNEGLDNISSPLFLSMIKSPLYKEYEYGSEGLLSSRLTNIDELGVGNPLAIIDRGEGKSRKSALNLNLRPSYSFLDDRLKVGVLFSYGWSKLNENSFIPDYGTSEYPLFNEQGEVYAFSLNHLQDRMDKHQSIVMDGRADWIVLKSSQNRLDAFAGYRYYSDHYKGRTGSGHNTGSDNTPQLQNTSLARTTLGVDDSWKSMSWYANVDYAYKSRYLLNVSAATDASSRFGKEADAAMHAGGVSWGLFPSVTGAWVVSSESFMRGLEAIDFLKLSAGYSLSGNDHLPNNATQTYLSTVKYYDRAYGLTLNNIGNEKLKWETTASVHAAIDASLFNNRWSLRAEVYSSEVSDLLTQKSLNELAGLRYYWSNEGKMTNKGFEVSTRARVLNGRDWKVNLGASIGHYKNMISSLPNGTFYTDVLGARVMTQEGMPAGVFYGYKTKGVLSTRQEAAQAFLFVQDKAGFLYPFEAGDMHFNDKDNNHIIDDKDMEVIGDPNPDFYGNFSLDAKWKRFTLGALFTYSYGNDVYNALRAQLESGDNIYNQSSAMQNRWVANGQVTDIPRATLGDPMGNARFSDRWIEDGSYLRFKSLSLRYELPLNLPFIQSVSVWGAVDNIYTFTRYLGMDPEFAYGNQILYQGVDAGLTPQTRSWNLGVKINL